MKKYCFAWIISMVMVAAVVFWMGREQTIPEPSLLKLDCVSFAHPEPALHFGTLVPPDKADLEKELSKVSGVARCIRLYSSDIRQREILPIARKLGLKVVLGAWINRNKPLSEVELDNELALAKSYPDIVEAIIVGNEVLTGGEMPIADVLPYLDKARAESPVPVSIAEVTHVWKDYPDLVKHVDFIAIHIYSFWDGSPATVEESLGQISGAYDMIQALYPDKKLFIAETGWPRFGKARGWLAPGLIEQSRFVRGFAALASQRGWTYSLVEAYDQPWKRGLEGSVGGNWGVFNPAGELQLVLSGTASGLPGWKQALVVILIVSALVSAVTARQSLRQGNPVRTGLLTPVLGALLVWQAQFLSEWVSDWPRLFQAGGLLLASCLFLAGLLRPCARIRTVCAALFLLYAGLTVIVLYRTAIKELFDIYTAVFALPVLCTALMPGQLLPRQVRGLGRGLAVLMLCNALLSVALSAGQVVQAWVWAVEMVVMAAIAWRGSGFVPQSAGQDSLRPD